jgi:hypothetical protein
MQLQLVKQKDFLLKYLPQTGHGQMNMTALEPIGASYILSTGMRRPITTWPTCIWLISSLKPKIHILLVYWAWSKLASSEVKS